MLKNKMKWQFVVPNADEPQEFFWETEYKEASLKISAEYTSDVRAILQLTIRQFDEIEHKTILTYYRRKVCKGLSGGTVFIEGVDRTMKRMQSVLLGIVNEDSPGLINV